MLTSKNWRVESVARLVLGVTMSWLLAGTLALGLSALWKERGGHFPPVAILAVTGIGVHGVGLLLIARFLRDEGRSWTAAFGFRTRTGPAVGWAVASTLVVGPAIYGLHQLSATLLERWGMPPTPQDSVELLMRSGWTVRIVIALFAVVLAPVVEEILFRGIFFTSLRDAGWPRAAAIVASVGFGLIHANRAAFVPLSVFGGFLAWLYLRTGNLLAPMVAHFLFNLVPFILVAAGVEFGR